MVRHLAAVGRKSVRKVTLEQAELSLKRRWTDELTEIVPILVHQSDFTGISESDRQLATVNIERYCVNIAGKAEDRFEVLLSVSGEGIGDTCHIYTPRSVWT